MLGFGLVSWDVSGYGVTVTTLGMFGSSESRTDALRDTIARTFWYIVKELAWSRSLVYWEE